MDLLQSAIRTLFYDVNIDRVLQEVRQGRCTFLKCDFASLSAWTNHEFTRSELTLLQTYVLQNTVGGMTPKWHHSLLLIKEFATKCLLCNKNIIPAVKFSSLIYWRDLSLLLGEDLFTTSFMAEKAKGLTSFEWPNIIGHDEKAINQVLKIGLSDVHAHLKASADIFELTWLDFMNRVVNRDETYKDVQYLADIRLISKRDEKITSFRKIVQIAAIIRMYLYEYLNGKCNAKGLIALKPMIDDDKR